MGMRFLNVLSLVARTLYNKLLPKLPKLSFYNVAL